MKVFNLACEREHTFEGWFGSAEDYDSQLARGLIECPVCGTRAIRKMPAAPRLNLSGAGEQPKRDMRVSPTPEQVRQLWVKMARHIVENTEDVGPRFAEEARRIHRQEAPERGIRGTASESEAEKLQEEGIEVFSFPMPKLDTEPLQ